MPVPEGIFNRGEGSDARPSHGVGEMILFGLMAASFNAEIVLTSNVVPVTCRHFTDSVFIISAIIACKRLFGSLIQPWASWRSDFVRTRLGRRRPFLLIGLPGAAVSLLLMGGIPGFFKNSASGQAIVALFTIFIVNCLLQIAVDLNWGVLEPLYADTFRQEQLGRAGSARQLLSNLLTLFMATFVVGWADRNEFLPYLFGAAIFLGALLIALFGVKEKSAAVPPPLIRYNLFSHLGFLLRSRDLIKLAVVCTANLALPAAISLLLPLYVTDTLGLSLNQLGHSQIIGVLLSALLAIPAGWLVDRLGAKWVMAGGFALFAFAAAALAGWAHDYPSLRLSMMLFGVAQMLALLPMTALVFQYCVPNNRGQIFGVVQFVRAFSTFLILLSLGFLTQFVPSREPTPFRLQDLRDLPGLVVQLQNPSYPAVRFFRHQLAPTTSHLLLHPVADSPQLPAMLTNDLNRLIQGPDLYTPDRFSGVKISSQSLSLLQQKNLNPRDIAVLNRSLINDAFPGLISRKINYRLPFEASIFLSLGAMLTALRTGKGRTLAGPVEIK